MIFFKCFFCLKANKNAQTTICHECINKFFDYKFYCCPRCSKFMCSGCENLSEFRTIFCEFSYNSVISKIIVNAKDKMHYVFQKIFYDIFYDPIFKSLNEILHHREYEAIFLSPYHKRRLFEGYWHPNLFFEQILNTLKQKYKFKYDIFMPHYTANKASSIYLYKAFPMYKNHIYLLCDDVLTSGKSAIDAQNAINKYINRPTDNSSMTWDLFSIFRSPQK